MARKKPWKMEWYGSDELLREIEKMGGNVKEAISKAVEKSFVPVKRDMQNFVSVQHIYSGDTKNAFRDADYYKWSKKDKLRVIVGYDQTKGGEAAIFLQVGTPRMAPYFFLTHAYHEHEHEIIGAQEKAVQDEFERLLNKVSGKKE